MRKITEINIHCSATKPGWRAQEGLAAQVAEIKRWHVEDNGWADIGYHYIIGRDGECKRGRKVDKTGAFEPKVNAHGIGVCLIGGYGSSATDDFTKHYTPEQDATLRKLLAILQKQHPGINKITGHNDYSSKACPGFKVQRWLAGAAPARTFAESGTAQGAGVATAAGGGLAVVEVARLVSDMTPQLKTAAAEIQTAKAEVQAAPVDPLRWVLLAAIVIGAGYALYRRWVDWKAGRQ